MTFDPSVAGLARDLMTVVWQTDGGTPAKPVGLWCKVDIATTAWSRIWPSENEAWFDVTITDGAIKNFGDHRRLRVHGLGPLVSIESTGLVGGTHLQLAFADASSIQDGTPATGTSNVRTVRNPADNSWIYPMWCPQDSIVTVGLLTDSGSSVFWKTGGV